MRNSDTPCARIEDLEQRLCLSATATAGAHHDHAALLARQQARAARLQVQRRLHRSASTVSSVQSTTFHTTSGVTFVTVTDLRTGRMLLVPVDNATGLVVTTLPVLDAFGNPVSTPSGFVTFGVGSTGSTIGIRGAIGGTEALQPTVPPVASPFGPQTLPATSITTTTTGFTTGFTFFNGSVFVAGSMF